MLRSAWVVLFLLPLAVAACASAPAGANAPSSPSSSTTAGSAPGATGAAVDGLPRPAGPREALALIRKIESDPFRQDEPFKAEVGGLLAWIAEAPNITVVLCGDLFPNFDVDKWPPEAVLVGQLTFAQAGYLIEHPGAPPQSEAVYTAGLTGAIRAYRKLIASHAGERQPAWDELDAAERQGRLGSVAGRGIQACVKKPSS